MYASRTKRLCVRGAQSDETRVHHHHPNSTPTINNSNTTTTNNNTAYTSSLNSLDSCNSRRQTSSRTHNHPSLQPEPLFSTQDQSQQAHVSEPGSSSQTATYLTQAVIVNSVNAMTNSNGAQNENLSSETNTKTHTRSFKVDSPAHQLIVDPISWPNSTTKAPPSSQAAPQLSISLGTANHPDQSGLEQDLILRLARDQAEDSRLELLIAIRNLITACNKKKDFLINNSNFSSIISLITDCNSSLKVKTQLVLLVCTLAKSGEHVVQKLNEQSLDLKIYNLVLEYCRESSSYYESSKRLEQKHNEQDQLELIEACFRALRSIMSWPDTSRIWLIYEMSSTTASSNPVKLSTPEIGHLRHNSLKNIINFAKDSESLVIQECVADLFSLTCDRGRDQNLLYEADAVSCIVKQLESKSDRVIRASVSWLSQMCLRNMRISNQVVHSTCPSGSNVLDKLTLLMSKHLDIELQFFAAQCFAYVCRAVNSSAVMSDIRLSTHVLPTLVRLVHKDQPTKLRIKSAECIAYLIEEDKRLQSTASICDHLIESLASMILYEEEQILLEIRDEIVVQKNHDRLFEKNSLGFNTSPTQHLPQPNTCSVANDCDLDLGIEAKRAAFLALASLASNLESIRKKVSNTSPIVRSLIWSLTSGHPRTIRAVLTCLLSLSRSVKQLRTSFSESSIYNSLKSLLFSSFNDPSSQSKDILILVVAILCNITLNFSSGKQHFLDAATVDIFCSLTKLPESTLRLHSVWILMNLVYEVEETSLRLQILQALDMPYILLLLQSDEEDEVILKTLGFMRNLMSRRQQVDYIMKTSGEAIISTLGHILNENHPYIIKEQAMCVLANIADGSESKDFIMNNDLVLHYIGEMLADLRIGDARLAALDCVRNLLQKEVNGAEERRDNLVRRGFDEKLKILLSSEDAVLVNRAQKAYNQFNRASEENYVDH